MQDNIDIKFLNNYISNIIKKKLNKTINIKGIICNLNEKKNNFFFSIKSEDDYHINSIFWKNNNKNTIKLQNNQIINGIAKIDFNLKIGSFYINFIDINILEDSNTKLEDLRNNYKDIGLFNKDRKWLNYSTNIAVITSLNGVVIHDIISVAKKKNNYCNIYILNSTIQGKDSVNDIIMSIEFINKKLKYIDTIIIARGGGNIYDLETFNNITLLQKVYESKIPIISAIGHEKDNTLIDYVADKSAITPSVAADTTFFNEYELIEKLTKYQHIIENNFSKIISKFELKLKNYYKKMEEISPIIYLNKYNNKLNYFEKVFNEKYIKYLNNIDNKINLYEDKLETNNLNNILKKGFSIVYDKDGNLIDDVFLFSSLSKLKMKLQFQNGYKYFQIDKIF